MQSRQTLDEKVFLSNKRQEQNKQEQLETNQTIEEERLTKPESSQSNKSRIKLYPLMGEDKFELDQCLQSQESNQQLNQIYQNIRDINSKTQIQEAVKNVKSKSLRLKLIDKLINRKNELNNSDQYLRISRNVMLVTRFLQNLRNQQFQNKIKTPQINMGNQSLSSQHTESTPQLLSQNSNQIQTQSQNQNQNQNQNPNQNQNQTQSQYQSQKQTQSQSQNPVQNLKRGILSFPALGNKLQETSPKSPIPKTPALTSLQKQKGIQISHQVLNNLLKKKQKNNLENIELTINYTKVSDQSNKLISQGKIKEKQYATKLLKEQQKVNLGEYFKSKSIGKQEKTQDDTFIYIGELAKRKLIQEQKAKNTENQIENSRYQPKKNTIEVSECIENNISQFLIKNQLMSQRPMRYFEISSPQIKLIEVKSKSKIKDFFQQKENINLYELIKKNFDIKRQINFQLAAGPNSREPYIRRNAQEFDFLEDIQPPKAQDLSPKRTSFMLNNSLSARHFKSLKRGNTILYHPRKDLQVNKQQTSFHKNMYEENMEESFASYTECKLDQLYQESNDIQKKINFLKMASSSFNMRKRTTGQTKLINQDIQKCEQNNLASISQYIARISNKKINGRRESIHANQEYYKE